MPIKILQDLLENDLNFVSHDATCRNSCPIPPFFHPSSWSYPLLIVRQLPHYEKYFEEKIPACCWPESPHETPGPFQMAIKRSQQVWAMGSSAGPFLRGLQKATEENRQKAFMIRKWVHGMCFPIGFHVYRYAKSKGILFWGVPGWCRTSCTVAFVQLSSGNRLCRLYICIFHTRMGEKPTATQNSAAIRYPNATESEELWYRKKKYTPSECVTLKAHTLINWSKISPIKIVRLDFVEDHIAHQVLHLQVQEDIWGSNLPQNSVQMASSRSKRRVECDP